MLEKKVYIEQLKQTKNLHKLLVKIGGFFGVKYAGEVEELSEEQLAEQATMSLKGELYNLQYLNNMFERFINALPEETYLRDKVGDELFEEFETAKRELISLVDEKIKPTDEKVDKSVDMLKEEIKSQSVEVKNSFTEVAKKIKKLQTEMIALAEVKQKEEVTQDDQTTLELSLKMNKVETEVQSLKIQIQDLSSKMKELATQKINYVKAGGSVGFGGSSTWGSITGTLGDQTDLQAALDSKSSTSHNHSGVYEPANSNIQSHITNTSNPHSVTKSQVGLGNVDNTSDANKPISSATQTALDAKESTANKGVAGGYASLDGSGKVPSAQLPSYVDDVLEYANLAALPVTGTTGVMYVTLDTNKTYRWSGSAYVEISPSPGSTDSVTEGSTNLYFTNERAQDAVGGALTDSSEIDFTYDDAAGTITATIKTGSIDESKLDASTNASLDLADTAVQPADIASFETTTQLNTRDTNNRNRANHTGTQLAATISDFASAVAALITGKSDVGHTHSASDITSGTKTSSFISDFSSAVAALITGKLDASAYDDATAAETDTGTSTSKYVSPDGLAGSNYGKRVVGILVVDPATDVATGDGKAFFRVPATLNGWNLVAVAMNVYTAGTTGTMDVQIRNVTDSQDMLSTKLTIDSTETDTSTAATAAVINTTYDDVATGDKIAIDVDAVQTTKAKGLYVELTFQLP